jgi:hypothetical protein
MLLFRLTAKTKLRNTQQDGENYTRNSRTLPRPSPITFRQIGLFYGVRVEIVATVASRGIPWIDEFTVGTVHCSRLYSVGVTSHFTHQPSEIWHELPLMLSG